MRDVDLIALAGLLHDIGKFRQRTGNDDLNDFDMGFAVCDKQKCSYLHAAHTSKAIEEMGFDSIENLINIAASHHKSHLDGLERIIQQADRLASSLDRKISLDELKKDDFISVALETPFSYTYLNNKPKKHYYKLQKLENSLKIDENKRCNNKEDYNILYQEFVKEVKELNLDFKSINDFLKLKSVFEKYTTFIPASSYKTYPDVSLYDHSLATSAIATAIQNGDGENFTLIQGDFTSIQNFIFSKFGDSNRYLAKILRAKSLFVNIATELVALKICKELNLSPYNIVMNAGGKFMILSHKIDKTSPLQTIRDWVNDEFSKINYLQTKFVIKSINFTKEKFKLGEFSKVFKELAYEFESEKLRFEPKQSVYENYIQDAKNGICNICGIVPLEEDKNEICKYCQKFKEIGEKLPKAKYINFNLDDILSISVDNKRDKEISLGLNTHPIKRIANVVPKFKKDDIGSIKYESIKDSETEIYEGSIKTFYHIACDGVKIKDDKPIGKNYLAILKADIDNLGEIFIRGFTHEQEEATFSRVLYLSRMIDYFFTDNLMGFIKEKSVYTVFAGGDDLFLIGHYEDIIKTYSWILQSLKEYTKNADFHLSAAIHFTRSNIPINLMAEFSEDDLERAKSLDKDKNAVTIFDISMKNDEFLQMLKKREFFEELHKDLLTIESGVAFIYKIYDFIKMRRDLEKNILNNARWKYLLRYLIEKNFQIRKNDKPQIKEAKERVREKLSKVGEMIECCDERLIVPLNLFLYSIRK